MKKLWKGLFPLLLSVVLIAPGCSSLNKTQKGAVIGTATGGTMGTLIGRAAGNTALGAIIGVAVGGTAGALIGRKMDKQAEEIAKSVPDAKVIRVGEGIVVEFSSSILFGFDQSNLTKEAANNLDKLVIILKDYPDTDIEVQGHTDSKGSEAYNLKLSEQRAETVSLYLYNKGISNNRLRINGFRELLPKYVNNTEEGMRMNRRVEFLITANEQMKAEAEKQAGI